MENSWKEFLIEDLCSIRRGASPRPIKDFIKPDGVIPWVKISDATASDSRYITRTGEKIIELGRNKSVEVTKGDLILSNSATPGLPKIMKIDACIHDGWLLLREFEGILKEYMYYLLINERERIVGYANGTVFQNLKTDILRKFKVKIPKMKEQQKIVSILSSLDDKIELNNEMNKTLEQMAQAIFKSWFVDFEPFKDGEFEESELGMIPKGWKVGNLGEIVEVNPKTVLTKGKKYSFVDMKNVPTNSVRIDAIINKEFSGGGSRFKNRDVIFARITPCLENGKTAIVDFLDENEVAFGSTEFLVFRGIDWNGMYYSYCLSRYNPFRVYAVQHMNGSSGRQRVSKGNIEVYKIVIPPKKLLLEFNKQVYCYFEKTKQNDVNSNSLKAIRDALLPKLISGEIKL